MSELNRDLGLGGKLAQEASVRLLNQNAASTPSAWAAAAGIRCKRLQGSGAGSAGLEEQTVLKAKAAADATLADLMFAAGDQQASLHFERSAMRQFGSI